VSTGCPRTILQRAQVEEVMAKRRNRALILIDISVPRNIDAEAQRLPNVYLYNIDDLEAVVRENVRNREQELALCHRVIDARSTELVEKLNSGKGPAPRSRTPLQSSWLFREPAIVSA